MTSPQHPSREKVRWSCQPNVVPSELVGSLAVMGLYVFLGGTSYNPTKERPKGRPRIAVEKGNTFADTKAHSMRGWKLALFRSRFEDTGEMLFALRRLSAIRRKHTLLIETQRHAHTHILLV